MRVLLTTIGSRGDVQPVLALALELRQLGASVHLCVPPDFREWIEGVGFSVTTIGPPLRPTGRVAASADIPSAEQRRQMIEGTIAAQFATLMPLASRCDVILGATALQVAAPSIAEMAGVPYVFAAFCPNVLPSPHHAPPVLALRGDAPAAEAAEYHALWLQDEARWNDSWGEGINAHRASFGLAPVTDVRTHVHTRTPWLAADVALGPWPASSESGVVQTGAWLLPDERPLAPDVERFLSSGEAPVYFGFGSIRAPEGLAAAMVGAARANGRRAIVLRGWAELAPIDGGTDCLYVDEVNQRALFGRVAAVVHHGGAGTTTAAARAGVPQVVIPQHYDQHYWASRVEALGLGVAHPHAAPTPESLTRALADVLKAEVRQRTSAFAPRVATDAARVAAVRLSTLHESR